MLMQVRERLLGCVLLEETSKCLSVVRLAGVEAAIEVAVGTALNPTVGF
jgi:hypothetical protein